MRERTVAVDSDALHVLHLAEGREALLEVGVRDERVAEAADVKSLRDLISLSYAGGHRS